MNVSVHTVIKNEEDILPFYLHHYKTNFPGCVIHIYDNNSSDRSLEICQAAGCLIGHFPTYSEDLLKEHKNNCWKNSDSDWVIICDADELIQITHEDLENLVGVDIVKFKGYSMILVGDEKPYKDMKHGCVSPPYNKCCLFRRNIPDINYSIGAHHIDPNPDLVISKYKYKLFHYKKVWFNEENYKKYHNMEELYFPTMFTDFMGEIKKLK